VDSFLENSSPSTHLRWFITKHRSFFTDRLLSTKYRIRKHLFHLH
jgi:hypothetical protein